MIENSLSSLPAPSSVHALPFSVASPTSADEELDISMLSMGDGEKTIIVVVRGLGGKAHCCYVPPFSTVTAHAHTNKTHAHTDQRRDQ